MSLIGIDYFILLLYLAGTIIIGLYYEKYVSTSSDYFLAGKMLPFWAIAISIVGTDIGAVDFVGLTGQAYRYGIVVANFDWIGSVPAMILAGLVFIPYYWRAGVFTIPEYLGKRYNIYLRVISAVIWLIFIAAIFDGLDGKVARKIRAESQFGLQLDSLSDVVSFGIAPSILVYALKLQSFGVAGWRNLNVRKRFSGSQNMPESRVMNHAFRLPIFDSGREKDGWESTSVSPV